MMHSPEDFPGTGDLPDRFASVKPNRARLWIELNAYDRPVKAATLAGQCEFAPATIYRILDGLAELDLSESVSMYRDGRSTTGYRTLEPKPKQVVADGGPVFEDGRATTCPDCGGDLQYQNCESIVCLGCGQDYEHWKNASSHHLVEVDARTGESEIVQSTPWRVAIDGGREAYTDDTEHSQGLVADRRTGCCVDSYTVDLSTCNVLGWVNVWLIANPRTVGDTTPERNKLVGGVVDSPASLTQCL